MRSHPRPARLRVGACWWPALGLAALAGCSTYDPKPLAAGPGAPPIPLEQIVVAAARLRHPLLAPLVIDGRDGFTPDEIAVMTVIANPALRAARDQRGVAQAQVLQAGLLPNPQFSYAVDRPVTPGYVTGQTVGLGWEVTSLLGYRDRVAGAKASATAVDLGLAWQEWQTAQDARLHAFRILALETRLPLARAIEADVADALALDRQAVARGQLAAGDLVALVEVWTSAQDARFSLEDELAAERLALNLDLGQPAATEIKLRAANGFPVLPGTESAAALLLDGLESHRLDLVALAAGYASAESGLRAAVQAQFPRIVFNFARANDTSDVRTRGFGVTVDLPLFDRNQGQIAIATATRQQLFDEYAARVAEARSTVYQILAQLRTAQARLTDVEAGLPEATRLATAYEQAMRSRNAEAASWRAARTALLARESEVARLHQELLELEVALEIATGRPLLNRSSVP